MKSECHWGPETLQRQGFHVDRQGCCQEKAKVLQCLVPGSLTSSMEDPCQQIWE